MSVRTTTMCEHPQKASTREEGLNYQVGKMASPTDVRQVLSAAAQGPHGRHTNEVTMVARMKEVHESV